MYDFKMAANKPFEISRHRLSRPKFEKHFPKGIFLRNLAHKLKECKCNYMAEIKLQKSYLVTILRDETSFE